MAASANCSGNFNASNFSSPLNCTDSESNINEEFTEPEELKWIRNVVYGILFIFGVVGNFLVILAFRPVRMKSVPNLFITNLAIADFLVSLVNVPLVAVHAHLSYWPFGTFMCKAISFLQGIALSASVGTMMAIAFDRYKVIVHYELPKMTLFQAKITIITIWMLSCTVPAPLLKYSDTLEVTFTTRTVTKCLETWTDPMQLRVYTLVVFLVLYFLPLLMICLLYGLIAKTFKGLPSAQKVTHEAQRRIVRMFVVVVTLFAVCWLPYHVLFLYIDYAQPALDKIYVSLVLSFQLLIYSNSACNPIVYAVYNTNYRRQFLRMLKLPHRKEYQASTAHAQVLRERRVVNKQPSCPVGPQNCDKEPETRRPTI